MRTERSATTASASTSPRSRSTWSRVRAGSLRVVGVAVAVALLTGAAATAWFLRDPEPVFARRTGPLASVDSAVPTLDGSIREVRLRLVSTAGLRAEIAVREPIGGTSGEGGAASGDGQRRPLFLILGGQRRGAGAGALLGETRGAVIASLDYPFDGDADAKGLALIAQVPAIRRAFYDIPPAVTLALDHLLTRPGIDPQRVEVVGASFGAPFATIAAARDTRVSRLWIAHGGGRPLLMIARGLEREIPMAALRWPAAVLANVLASGPRFAPERFIGRVAPRPVVMLNASDDERIPRASVDALWSAAREPREQVWLPGQHMLGSRPDVLRTLVDSVMARAAVPSPGP